MTAAKQKVPQAPWGGKINTSTLLSAFTAEPELPQLREVVYHFFRRCGGAAGVAELLHREYQESLEDKTARGALTRQRIFDLLIDGLKFAEKRQLAAPDVTDLSDADLERELGAELAKVLPYVNPEATPGSRPDSPGPDRVVQDPVPEPDPAAVTADIAFRTASELGKKGAAKSNRKRKRKTAEPDGAAPVAPQGESPPADRPADAV